MKVAIYTRVSKDDQNPENQELELKEYIQNHQDMVLYNVYEDRISGIKDSRPALDELMQDARKHLFNHVLVWKIDRLGRSTAHFHQIMDEWKKLGITFSISTLGLDTSTPVGRFVTGLLSQVAELERQFIVDRINLSINRAKKSIEEKGYYVTKDGKKITSLGRPRGKKDGKVRKKSGYYQRWSKKSSPLKKGNSQRREDAG